MGNEYSFDDIFSGTMGLKDTEDNILYHDMFRRSWERELRRGSENNKDHVEYGKNQVVYLYDSLKPILKEMDQCPDKQEAYEKVFNEQIEKMTKFNLCEPPAKYVWYNKTIEGIDLRPGRIGNSNLLPEPVVMKGEDSHSVVAGTTGSGKSVFLNNLLLNMMVEYPPWELEIYLADFKKVEMSRYMNKYEAPHVRTCAATGEVDYVHSLIMFIKERKDDREKIFARLGVKNIAEFREKYTNVIMPRIILVVDEFQQLFLDASPSQKMVIEDLITNIARKGRSSGVHLLFASQEMQGALNKNQMANFNLRFALHCDSAVSSDILGDTTATELHTGQVIVKNTKGSQQYQVPLAEDAPDKKKEVEYFYRILKELYDYAKALNYHYLSTQKFYDEDKQKDISDLTDLLNLPPIRSVRLFSGNEEEKKKKFISMVLGRNIVYSPLRFDIANIFISYSKNRCILCLSENNEDLAYFQKLIAENVRSIASERDCIDEINRPFADPFFFELNQQIASIYKPEARLMDFGCIAPDIEYSDGELMQLEDEYFFKRVEQLEVLQSAYDYRKKILQLLRNLELNNFQKVFEAFLREEMEEAKRDEEFIEGYIETIRENGLKDINDQDILTLLDSDLSFLGLLEDDIADLREIMILYYRYRIAKIRPVYKLFQPTLVMITGIENMEKVPGWLAEFCSNCMDYNFLTIFFSSTSVNYAIKQASNYFFVAGADPKLYDDYLGSKPPKGDNGLKFRCWIKNTNQKFGFKKYRWDEIREIPMSIDFDSILADY